MAVTALAATGDQLTWALSRPAAQVMATQGMTAALAASSFLALDKDRDGVISASDIINAFSSVGGISYQQACEMARLIIVQGDLAHHAAGGTGGTGAVAGDGKLNFVEYVSVLAQDMMPLDQLLVHMDELAEQRRRAGKRLEQPAGSGGGHSGDDGVQLGVSQREFEASRRSYGISSPSFIARQPTSGAASVIGSSLVRAISLRKMGTSSSCEPVVQAVNVQLRDTPAAAP